MKRRGILWLPLALILMLFVVFWVGLHKQENHDIASQMVGKPLPPFTAAAALSGQPGVNTVDFRDGRPPCVAEVPVLLRLKAMGIDVVGIAIHDTTPALTEFLGKNGNPYSRIGLDQTSRLQIAIGSSGVPETFVIDGQGKIIRQHIGAVAEDDIPALLAALGHKP
jgi:cytochrome c biogenesis protein CcmG/thiol:disulfide interchange protein DsbE